MTDTVESLTQQLYNKIDEISSSNNIDENSINLLSIYLSNTIIKIISIIRNDNIINNINEIDIYKSETYNNLVYYQNIVNKIYSKHIASTLWVNSLDDLKQIILNFTCQDNLITRSNLQDRLFYLLDNKISFIRENHLLYINRHLWIRDIEGNPKLLDVFYLDASQPWILYWMIHSLDLMSESISPTLSKMVSDSVNSFWDMNGGYGGGDGQMGNVITTYACVCLQYIIGLDGLNLRRNEVYKFLYNCKLNNNAFQVHENGEFDTRSTFCSIATASLLNILTNELIDGVDKYISSCQSYDGGIAGQPGLESHAAYSFCGLATLCILGKANAIDLNKLRKWCENRLMKIEFGFQGRPNKLVDSCYSYWVGATIYLLNRLNIISNEECKRILSWSKLYLLLVCQCDSGFRDKPGKDPDLYHTCYSLSSLALTENVLGKPCKLSPIDPLHILTQYTLNKGKKVLEFDDSFKGNYIINNPIY